jgi:hypothetical protein
MPKRLGGPPAINVVQPNASWTGPVSRAGLGAPGGITLRLGPAKPVRKRPRR